MNEERLNEQTDREDHSRIFMQENVRTNINSEDRMNEL